MTIQSSVRTIAIAADNPHGEIAAQLIRELSADLARRYSDRGDDGSGHFAPSDVTVPRSVFLIARLDGKPVGCGALRPIDAEAAELKRMYVAQSARRMGVGRRLLIELERFARESGYRVMRLETGIRQPEAIALYESYGFYSIPVFGCYVENPMSVCYEKKVGVHA